MSTQDFSFFSYKTTIFGRDFRSKTVKGVVVLVHGMGEHSGRYIENVIPALIDISMAVVVYDNIGHGKSGGKRGHCPSYDALQHILNTAIEKAMVYYPNKPVFLYGHSMGGNLVLNYILRKDNIKISGVVATSPYLRLAFQPPKWKMVLGKLMQNILPSITLPSGLDSNGISRIPEEVLKYNADPLVHDKVSPMFSFPIMDAGEWAIANAASLKTSTLLIHGTSDKIIDVNGTIEFHENSHKTTLQLFDGGYHELHYDYCKDEMLQVLQNWLQQQL